MPKRIDISKMLIIAVALSSGLELRGQVAPKDFKYSPPSSPCSKIRLIHESGQPASDQKVLLKKVSIHWSYLGGQKAFEAKSSKLEWQGATNGGGEIDLSTLKKQPYFLEVKGKSSAHREINLADNTNSDCSTEFVLNEISKGHWLLNTRDEIATRKDVFDQIHKLKQQRKH